MWCQILLLLGGTNRGENLVAMVDWIVVCKMSVVIVLREVCPNTMVG